MTPQLKIFFTRFSSFNGTLILVIEVYSKYWFCKCYSLKLIIGLKTNFEKKSCFWSIFYCLFNHVLIISMSQIMFFLFFWDVECIFHILIMAMLYVNVELWELQNLKFEKKYLFSNLKKMFFVLQILIGKTRSYQKMRLFLKISIFCNDVSLNPYYV